MVRGWGGGGVSRPDLESEETREEERAVKDGEMLWSISQLLSLMHHSFLANAFLCVTMQEEE